MIRIVPDELSGTSCEAILRPASAEWSAVTPAMRRLELAAGPALEAQCLALDELPVGSAVITGAGALTARFMIHVIVRSMDEQVSITGVRRGMQNGLRRLAEWGVASVAMAPLGTGAGNLDADDSASIMIPLLAAAVRAGGPPVEVVIHADSDYEREVFERHVRAAGPLP